MNDINNEATETPGNDKQPALSASQLKDTSDLTDSPHDQERMKQEEFTIDLPDVADIPGQEFVHVPPMGELSDITISSDDEEGAGLFEEEQIDGDAEIVMGNEADVAPEEKKALRTASEDMPSSDNALLREASLDNRDFEGEPLNEGSSATKISGADMDVSGAEADDANEEIGEEDEENNPYSLGADDNDDIPSDSF